MSDTIEQLTEDERGALEYEISYTENIGGETEVTVALAKALRIIDAQAAALQAAEARIAKLQRELDIQRADGLSATSSLGGQLYRTDKALQAAAARIAELERMLAGGAGGYATVTQTSTFQAAYNAGFTTANANATGSKGTPFGFEAWLKANGGGAR